VTDGRTDRQTDGQTDRQTDGRAIAYSALSMLSRAKNDMYERGKCEYKQRSDRLSRRNFYECEMRDAMYLEVIGTSRLAWPLM